MHGVLLQCIQYSRREKCALGITKDNVLEFYHRRPSTGLSSYGFAAMKTKNPYLENTNTIQPNDKSLKAHCLFWHFAFILLLAKLMRKSCIIKRLLE